MRRDTNYRAARAERTRKKAEKKQARLASLARKTEDTLATEKTPAKSNSLPAVHRFSD